MNRDEPDSRPPSPRVGTEREIHFHFQYEFERKLSELRSETDPSKIQNDLSELIADLAAEIIASTDDSGVRDEVRALLEEISDERINPVMQIDLMKAGKVRHYQCLWDSKPADVLPENMKDFLQFAEVNMSNNVIRKLWVIYGKMRIHARIAGVFSSSFVVADSVASKREKVRKRGERRKE